MTGVLISSQWATVRATASPRSLRMRSMHFWLEECSMHLITILSLEVSQARPHTFIWRGEFSRLKNKLYLACNIPLSNFHRSNMNLKPPTYWRPRGPSHEKDILNVTCLDVSNIIGHRYVKHDKSSNFSPNSTNTFLPVQKARELSPLSSPVNRHGLINVALDGKREGFIV